MSLQSAGYEEDPLIFESMHVYSRRTSIHIGQVSFHKPESDLAYDHDKVRSIDTGTAHILPHGYELVVSLADSGEFTVSIQVCMWMADTSVFVDETIITVVVDERLVLEHSDIPVHGQLCGKSV